MTCQLTGGFMRHVASTCSVGLSVQVLGGQPPDERVHAAASLYTC